MSHHTLRLELLDKNRREIFALLSKFKRYGYLAGGTALALQIAHRYSYDFDIFCHAPIKTGLIQQSRATFSLKTTLQNTTEEFTFLTHNNIKITFLHYPFTFTGALLAAPHCIPLLSIKNIAISKAYTIGRRGNARDYVDLYYIMNATKLSLQKIIQGARVVYGKLFNPKLFLGQLVYTDDLTQDDIQSIVYIKKKIPFATIQNFFVKEVSRIQQQLL